MSSRLIGLGENTRLAYKRPPSRRQCCRASWLRSGCQDSSSLQYHLISAPVGNGSFVARHGAHGAALNYSDTAVARGKSSAKRTAKDLLAEQLDEIARAAESVRQVANHGRHRNVYGSNRSHSLLSQISPGVALWEDPKRQVPVTLERGVENLGSGGHGQVLEGVDSRTGQAVAIKVAARNAGATCKALLKLEFAAMALLDSEHIIKPLGWCLLEVSDGGGSSAEGLPHAPSPVSPSATSVRWGFVMPVVKETLSSVCWDTSLQAIGGPGSSKRDVFRVRRPCAAGTCGTHIAQIAQALSYLHSLGVAHGDIKPWNVLVRPDGVAQLCDFATIMSTRSRAHFRVGTEYYIAPERTAPELLPSGCAASPSALDVFALGVCVSEVLAGEICAPLMSKHTKHHHLCCTGLDRSSPAYPLAPPKCPQHADLEALASVAASALAANPDARPPAFHFTQAGLCVARGSAASMQLAAGHVKGDKQLRREQEVTWHDVEREAASAKRKATAALTRHGRLAVPRADTWLHVVHAASARGKGRGGHAARSTQVVPSASAQCFEG